MAYEASVSAQVPLEAVFFGGGTPSLMPPALVAGLIAAAERHWGFADDVEITLEANPSSVEAERFTDLAAAGVNRLSLGIQALDNEALRFLGRAHDVHEGLAALDIAQHQFGRVSFDLIYARPGQTPAAWDVELNRAIGLGTGHLSLYQLTIEPGTRFSTDYRDRIFTLPNDGLSADLYMMTQDIMVAAGLPAYEISNHARSGEESRHNLNYWRYGSYLGIGPGAHGRRLNNATQRHKKPENFQSSVTRNDNGLQSEILLSPHDRATEALLMGLRLTEGVDLATIVRDTGLAETQFLETAAIDRLIASGHLDRCGDRLCLTPGAFILLDYILPEIVRLETPAMTA